MIPRYLLHLSQSNQHGGWWGQLRNGDGELIADATSPDCMGVLSELGDALADEQHEKKGNHADD